MILINFCVFAALLNSLIPDWDDARLGKLNVALDCLTSNSSDKSCATALDYLKLRGFDISTTNQQKIIPQLKTQIDYYLKKSADENSFNIPIFNVSLDVNDL